MTEQIYYGGIGARDTPANTLFRMTAIAVWLASKGLRLRSGRGKGADEAFEAGAGGKAQIFKPFPNYKPNVNFLAEEVFESPTPEAYEIAAVHHPAWHRCDDVARALHARNSHIVLGPQLDYPDDFIVCYTLGSGGTAQALRVAQANDIKIFNLAIDRHEDELRDYVEERYS